MRTHPHLAVLNQAWLNANLAAREQRAQLAPEIDAQRVAWQCHQGCGLRAWHDECEHPGQYVYGQQAVDALYTEAARLETEIAKETAKTRAATLRSMQEQIAASHSETARLTAAIAEHEAKQVTKEVADMLAAFTLQTLM